MVECLLGVLALLILIPIYLSTCTSVVSELDRSISNALILLVGEALPYTLIMFEIITLQCILIHVGVLLLLMVSVHVLHTHIS